MAVTATPIFPQALNVTPQTIVNGDGTTAKTVFTAGSNGSKLEVMNISSTDTSNRDVAIYLTRSAVNYLLTTIKILANSGNNNAIPATDCMKNAQIPSLSIDAAGNRFLLLKSGDTVSVAATTTVTAAKTITIITNGADY